VAHDGPQLTADVHEGSVLAGKYRVDKVLGIGGMGVVVAARHLQLDTKVAIKFLLPAMLASPDAVARFAREARAAVKITSEHVARVFDVGTLETGAPYMVMEFLEGGDLASWIQQRGAMPVETALDFVLQACVAVAEAHGLGIVHRDLKPANLFCVRRADGKLSIKVLDFGISKFADTSGSASGMSMTKTSAMMGSPLYMSPEQMRSSKDVDLRTDIWALGVVLYELLAGRVPFNGDTIPEVCVKIATEAPPPFRVYRRDAPEGLEAVVFRCLEKDPGRRYRNVAEFALAMAEFAPRSARATVDRITGIVGSAGASSSGLPLPPTASVTSTMMAPGTISPLGGTAPGRTAQDGAGAGRRAWALVGAGIAIAAALTFVAVRRAPGSPDPAVAAAAHAASPPAEPATSETRVLPSVPVREAPVALAAPAAPDPTAAVERAVNAPSALAKTAPSHSTPHPRKAPEPVTPPPSPLPAAPPPAPSAHHAVPSSNPLDLQIQ
jgi:eukaryotic-like serine/threonine-protein kinase